MNPSQLDALSDLVAQSEAKSFRAETKSNFHSDFNVYVSSWWLMIEELDIVISNVNLEQAHYIQIYKLSDTRHAWLSGEEKDGIEIPKEFIAGCVNHCKQQHQLVQQFEALRVSATKKGDTSDGEDNNANEANEAKPVTTSDDSEKQPSC